MVDLNEPDAALGQPPRQQAGVRECAALCALLSVQLVDAVGFLRQVRQLRHGGLHAERHLELRDARQRLRVAHLAILNLVQPADAIEHPAAHLAAMPSGLLRYSTGSPVCRSATPAYCAGRNPAPQSRAEIGCTFALGWLCDAFSTTNAGRS